MPSRQEYNSCMRPYITGKDKTKEERRTGFCIGAKICSGKAKTEDEAVKLCNKPKLPKWAKGGEKTEEEKPLPCPERMHVVALNIDSIIGIVKAGQTDNIKETLSKTLKDIHECREGQDDLIALATDTFEEVKKTTSEYYFRGEGREMVSKLKIVRNLIEPVTEEE